jgi:hypothetical protein
VTSLWPSDHIRRPSGRCGRVKTPRRSRTPQTLGSFRPSPRPLLPASPLPPRDGDQGRRRHHGPPRRRARSPVRERAAVEWARGGELVRARGAVGIPERWRARDGSAHRRRRRTRAAGPRWYFPVEQGAPGDEVRVLLWWPVRVRVSGLGFWARGVMGSFTPKGLTRFLLTCLAIFLGLMLFPSF